MRLWGRHDPCANGGCQPPWCAPHHHYKPVVDNLITWHTAKHCASRDLQQLRRNRKFRVTNDFAHGFREAYNDIALGRDQSIPPVPPQKYWYAYFRSPAGQRHIDEWYEGYRTGLAMGRDGGVDQFNEVAMNWDPGLPRSAVAADPAGQFAGGSMLPPHATQGPPPNLWTPRFEPPQRDLSPYSSTSNRLMHPTQGPSDPAAPYTSYPPQSPTSSHAPATQEYGLPAYEGDANNVVPAGAVWDGREGISTGRRDVSRAYLESETDRPQREGLIHADWQGTQSSAPRRQR